MQVLKWSSFKKLQSQERIKITNKLQEKMADNKHNADENTRSQQTFFSKTKFWQPSWTCANAKYLTLPVLESQNVFLEKLNVWKFICLRQSGCHDIYLCFKSKLHNLSTSTYRTQLFTYPWWNANVCSASATCYLKHRQWNYRVRWQRWVCICLAAVIQDRQS